MLGWISGLWRHTPLGWLTIPAGYNLAISRRWHLLFALVPGFGLLAFTIASLINRRFQRDLRVRTKEMGPRDLWADKARNSIIAHPYRHPPSLEKRSDGVMGISDRVTS